MTYFYQKHRRRLYQQLLLEEILRFVLQMNPYHLSNLVRNYHRNAFPETLILLLYFPQDEPANQSPPTSMALLVTLVVKIVILWYPR